MAVAKCSCSQVTNIPQKDLWRGFKLLVDIFLKNSSCIYYTNRKTTNNSTNSNFLQHQNSHEPKNYTSRKFRDIIATISFREDGVELDHGGMNSLDPCLVFPLIIIFSIK